MVTLGVGKVVEDWGPSELWKFRGGVMGKIFHGTLIMSDINQIFEISIQQTKQSDQVMTEKEYYLWSNKFINWCIHAGPAALFRQIYIEMQAANENK